MSERSHGPKKKMNEKNLKTEAKPYSFEHSAQEKNLAEQPSVGLEHWRQGQETVVDIALDADPSEAEMKEAGYAVVVTTSAGIECNTITFGEKPERVYLVEDERRIHSFWVKSGGGTAEFDVERGRVVHMDSFGCDVSISGTEFIFRPHHGGGDRLIQGAADYKGPRNSREYLLSLFKVPKQETE